MDFDPVETGRHGPRRGRGKTANAIGDVFGRHLLDRGSLVPWICDHGRWTDEGARRMRRCECARVADLDEAVRSGCADRGREPRKAWNCPVVVQSEVARPG